MLQSNNQQSKNNPHYLLWLIDDDPTLRLVLEDNFTSEGIEVISFSNAHGAWVRLNDYKSKLLSSQAKTKQKEILPHAILTDIRMPMMDGLSFSDWLSKELPEIPIIIMTAHSDLKSAIDSYQTGAFEYLPKPFDLDDATAIVRKAMNKGIQQAKTKIVSNESNNKQGNHKQSNNKQSNNKQSNNKQSNNKQSNNKQIANNKNYDSDGGTHPERKNLSEKNKQVNKKSDTANTIITTTTHTPITARKNFTENNVSTTQSSQQQETCGIIGKSMAMQTVFRAIGRLAHSPITVLITGESGTGKELIAQALHQTSARKDQQLIALNMSAIPHDLIESELFGHEKGAFTGATSTRIGRFEQANGGTLFLDEIGDMPFSTQTRLLRVLSSGEFFRVGGKNPIKVDVRIISATHQNLEKMVKQGKFREDLFYRLNVIRLPLPPLRDRPEDIPALINHFLEKSADELNGELKSVDLSAMQVLQSYPWWGNVRQLENACRWLTVMSAGHTVYPEDLPPELLYYMQDLSVQTQESSVQTQGLSTQTQQPTIHSLYPQSTAPDYHENTYKPEHKANDTEQWLIELEVWIKHQLQAGESDILEQSLPDLERVLINQTMLYCKGRKGKASELLGWGRNTLTRKIQQLGLDDRW